MSDLIKRKFERYIAAKLTGVMPTMAFLSSTGGGETEDARDIEPPFSIVTALELEKILGLYGQWAIKGTVQVVTHMSEHTPTAHSELSELVKHHMSALEPEVVEDNIAFHGIDISGMRYADNEDERIRVTAIDFTAGAGG